ncbi:hypothetical protein [Roseospira goensis]|uniref:Uncharacterized protein n=1 Tax=Roseospira goensis TaxID=391922 RepID=A0A7W6RWJ4_9PROT|nr:hypothetical protein [Roseospira goensis]MBB4284540.1 hypothetical protein [Roseospira goensis]
MAPTDSLSPPTGDTPSGPPANGPPASREAKASSPGPGPGPAAKAAADDTGSPGGAGSGGTRPAGATGAAPPTQGSAQGSAQGAAQGSTQGATEGATKGTTYTLKAINRSTVSGAQYFNVYPPALTVSPPQPQTVIPLVSAATVSGGKDGGQESATLSWAGGADALVLIAVAPGQTPDGAVRLDVTPGSTVAVAWKDNAFTLTETGQGNGSGITVTFGPDVPGSSRVGLIVGPGTILVSVPVSGATLIMTPDLSTTVGVVFGTPDRPGGEQVRDVSPKVSVEFKTTHATIVVGPDNLITQNP